MKDGRKLSDAELERLRQIINGKVRSFVQSPEERHDCEQEIWLRIIKRLRSFDAARASLGTFLFHVIESASADLRRIARRPRRGGPSLNDVIGTQDGGGCERVAMVSAEEQEFALGHRRSSQEEQTDLALDMAEAIEHLPPELRVLCDLLREATVSEVADGLRISRATVYRKLQLVRRHLEDKRLEIYLEVENP